MHTTIGFLPASSSNNTGSSADFALHRDAGAADHVSQYPAIMCLLVNERGVAGAAMPARSLVAWSTGAKMRVVSRGITTATSSERAPRRAMSSVSAAASPERHERRI